MSLRLDRSQVEELGRMAAKSVQCLPAWPQTQVGSFCWLKSALCQPRAQELISGGSAC